MKKMYLFAAVVIAAVAGTVCYNHESDNEMSETAKANIKALAMDDDDDDKECLRSPMNECVVWIVKPNEAYSKKYYDKRNPMEIID